MVVEAAPGETVLTRVARIVRREPVLVLSLALAILSMFLNPPSRQYLAYMDFKVLGCLFALMAVVSAFRSIGMFERLSIRLLSRVKTTRQVSALLVGLAFFSSMLITNDVALITFVPFTLVVFGMLKDPRPIIITIVLQTVAANVGSSLTPMGNPQNLYLFSFYGMDAHDFFVTMVPLVGVGGIVLLLMLSVIGGRNQAIVGPGQEDVPPLDKRKVARYFLLFVFSVLAVFDVVPWYLVVPVVAVTVGREQLRTVDYGLLLTFVGFFIFVGNLGDLPAVRSLIERMLSGRVFLVSLFASQFLSNVPAALLLSHFTDESAQLLLGVNAGGCGTLIASLASVISFKFFAAHDAKASWRYLWVFTKVNILFVLVFVGTWLIG
ncbi:MAG: SLC13 family permease [Sphaerochaetaceae bacterium]|nr:SLC13 family permease [Sphaerochaetaceae bacterium]